MLISLGLVVFQFFSGPLERDAVSRDEVVLVGGNSFRFVDFGYYSGEDNTVSFKVLNATIKTCEPLTTEMRTRWEKGQYEPKWIETNFASYEYPKGNFSYPLIGPIELRFFLFVNEDSYDKVIHWNVHSYWNESNTASLSVAYLLISVGAIAALAILSYAIIVLRSSSVIQRY
jgi:hypothetical protein